MYLKICVGSFRDEDRVLQVLHNRHIICDIQTLPGNKFIAKAKAKIGSSQNVAKHGGK